MREVAAQEVREGIRVGVGVVHPADHGHLVAHASARLVRMVACRSDDLGDRPATVQRDEHVAQRIAGGMDADRERELGHREEEVVDEERSNRRHHRGPHSVEARHRDDRRQVDDGCVRQADVALEHCRQGSGYRDARAPDHDRAPREAAPEVRRERGHGLLLCQAAKASGSRLAAWPDRSHSQSDTNRAVD